MRCGLAGVEGTGKSVFSGSMVGKHVLLLTGSPGVGKTTVIRRAVGHLRQHRLGGFYTEEIRERGVRTGFRLCTFEGTVAVMAHVERPKAFRVGRYGVDVSAIDRVAGTVLDRVGEKDFYLVDEIGKMECLSPAFVTGMQALLSSHVPVVATIAQKGTGFIAEVKGRADVEIWQVTPSNRHRLPHAVLGWSHSIL